MKKHLLKIGDIVWVKFIGEGHIQSGIRPAVVVQNNKGNYYSDIIQVVPLTSSKTKAKLPTHVVIPEGTGGLSKESIALCEGTRPISKNQVLGYIGQMPDTYLAQMSVASIINTPIIKFLSQSEIINLHEKTLMS